MSGFNRVTTQAWLRDDLENIISALSESGSRIARASPTPAATAYSSGYADALNDLRRALGIAPDTTRTTQSHQVPPRRQIEPRRRGG
jgi:hypothetical protein